jgi:hypothetical protein
MNYRIPARFGARIALVSFVILVWPGSTQEYDPPSRPHFRDVYAVLQQANCRSCHTDGGLAAATRLRFPAESARSAEIEAFGQELHVLIDRSHPEQSLLLRKPTARENHTGGQLIVPGSKQEQVLSAWAHHLAAAPAPEVDVGQPRPTRDSTQAVSIRRITNSQYNNTIRDLLGDESRPADRFPPESFVHGFKNQAQGQSLPPLLADAYSLAAERLARNAFRAGDINGLIPCQPASVGDFDCALQFVTKFGRKAFRRPTSTQETTRLLKLFRASAAETNDFLRGAQMVVEAILQSPKFLFHVEQGEALRAYEIANRLSYFLWDSMPDDSLLDLAGSGGLDTVEGVERAARRMLVDPRARQGLDEFISQWLRFDMILGAVKDRRVYPEFTPELAMAMAEETRRLVAHIVWSDRSFLEIFNADFTFLNSELARLYDLQPPTIEFELVRFPSDSGRAGVLGHASFLTLTSKPEETSPTIRGVFVREHFLCQTVPDPPPGTNANLPPLDEQAPQTNQQRLSRHVTNPSCAGCHNLIDPVGFGLEGFDAIGKRREKQTLHFFPSRADMMEDPSAKPKTIFIPLDPKGIIDGISASSFSSPRDLGRILADSPECQECIVRQLFRYAFGRKEGPRDRVTIEESTSLFRRSGFRFQELLISLVTSNEFLRVGPAEGP